MIENVVKTEIANGVRACFVKAEHFKTNVMSVHIVLPLESDMEANALLCYMLRRRCGKYPAMTALNRRLAELYGASLACGVSKCGDSQDICFRIVSPELLRWFTSLSLALLTYFIQLRSNRIASVGLLHSVIQG